MENSAKIYVKCCSVLHDHADKYNLIHGKFGKSYAKLPRIARCTMKLIKSQIYGKFGKNLCEVLPRSALCC